MGFKRVLRHFQTVGGTTGVSGVMTGVAVIRSRSTQIENLDNIGLDISWTGTPVGNMEVQCAMIDEEAYYKTLTIGIPNPAGTSGGYLVSLNQVPFPFVRVKYTNSAGVGALTVLICGKDLN